jgi:PKD domain-containing protein
MDVYTADVTLTLTNTTPVVTPPSNQMATEAAGQSFNLGSFSDPDLSPWAVDVSWGDGMPDTRFNVTTVGSLGTQPHTYAEDGTYPVTATVTDRIGLSGSATYHVVVAEAATTVSGPMTVKGKKVNNDVVATFTHGDGSEPANAFIAAIDWGDGGPSSTGDITQSGVIYTVRGTHTYRKGGAHVVTTTVTEVGEGASSLALSGGSNSPTATTADAHAAALSAIESGSGWSGSGSLSDQEAMNLVATSLAGTIESSYGFSFPHKKKG